jgi:transposase-like protein
LVVGRRSGHESGQLSELGIVLQTCIVHLIRNSLDYASWKDRKALVAAIKPVYTAPSAEAALAELDAFEEPPMSD